MSSDPFDDQTPPSPYPVSFDSYQRSDSFGPSLTSNYPHDPIATAHDPHTLPAMDAHQQYANDAAQLHSTVLFDGSAFADSLSTDALALPLRADSQPFTFPPFAADDDSSASFTSSSHAANFPSFPSFPVMAATPHSIASSGIHMTSPSIQSSSVHAQLVPRVMRPIASAAPSVSSSSSSQRSSSPPAPSRAPLKKRRVRGLPPEQRIERRRAQHRAVDAARRQKENEAIERLQTLLKDTQQRHESQEAQDGPTGVEAAADDDGAEEEGEGSGSGSSDGNKKVGRLTVLESSIALIQQLTAACEKMEAACNAKDAQLSRVSSHLHGVAASIAQQATAVASRFDDDIGTNALSPYHAFSSSALPPSYSSLSDSTQASSPSSTFLSVLPRSTSSYLTQSDRSHTLHRSFIAFSSSLCVTMIEVRNGVILDLNDRFLDCTGWRRGDLLHTSMDHEDMAGGFPLSPFLLRQRGNRYGQPVEYLPQYPSAMAEIDLLMRGEKRKADCRWRCRMGDGTVFECHTTMWSEWDEHCEPRADRDMYGLVQQPNGNMCVGVIANGSTQQRSPDRMVLVFAIEDAVIVEKLEDWRLSDD